MSIFRKLSAAAALLCLCLSARAQFDVRVRHFVQDDLRKGGAFYDIGSYTRFVPPVLHMGLGLAGAPSKHALLDRTIEETIAYSCALSTGYLLKAIVKRERPNGRNHHSFPSGHTLFAFTGAELTLMDYGWGWGGGAYAFALITGADRLWGDEHWLTDVLAGMGIGILSAHVGGWLLEPAKKLFGIPDLHWDGLGTGRAELSLVPMIDPLGNNYSASVALRF